MHIIGSQSRADFHRLGEDDFHNLELHLRIRRGEVRTILLSRVIIELAGERMNLKQFYDISARKQNETQLTGALQRVMSDTDWFAQKVMQELAEVRIGDKEPGPVVDLSRRER